MTARGSRRKTNAQLGLCSFLVGCKDESGSTSPLSVRPLLSSPAPSRESLKTSVCELRRGNASTGSTESADVVRNGKGELLETLSYPSDPLGAALIHSISMNLRALAPALLCSPAQLLVPHPTLVQQETRLQAYIKPGLPHSRVSTTTTS